MPGESYIYPVVGLGIKLTEKAEEKIKQLAKCDYLDIDDINCWLEEEGFNKLSVEKENTSDEYEKIFLMIISFCNSMTFGEFKNEIAKTKNKEIMEQFYSVLRKLGQIDEGEILEPKFIMETFNDQE